MTKVDQQSFDMIHGTQEIFRKLLDSMSRPGKVNNIHDAVQFIESVEGLSQAMTGIAFTLIDREASFHIISKRRSEVIQYLRWTTFAKHEDITKVSYVFIHEPLDEKEIYDVMSQVNRGTLENPHESATIIINVDRLSNGKKLLLSGPGIDGTKECFIEGLPAAWITERERVNKEYPIGVDFIFVTQSGDLTAIPRTTTIESECS
ncbi:phosphonate C-P lyase system protein PhnH [Pseudalkalibacillus sp. A8]|uniref:phosphonate C-P lyase system protein PhnH n=1 Tax=Pseudalkalibacillus sp. A8 TaxID=3382641 RepID=UPI0038B5646F